MPLFLENFDLGFLRKSKETISGLMRHIAQEGKPIIGYYGLPYFNLHYGDVQLILRTARSKDGSRYVENQPNRLFKKRLICSYTPSDAWAGEIHSELSAKQHIQLEDAFTLGKQFFKDFKFFQEQIDGNNYDDNMLTSLMLVQNLGCFYSKKCLGW